MFLKNAEHFALFVKKHRSSGLTSLVQMSHSILSRFFKTLQIHFSLLFLYLSLSASLSVFLL